MQEFIYHFNVITSIRCEASASSSASSRLPVVFAPEIDPYRFITEILWDSHVCRADSISAEINCDGP